MSYCGQRSLVKQDTPSTKTAVSLRCRSWQCPDCAPTRQKGLMAQAIGGAPNTFLTLTSRRRADQTANQAAAALSRAWRLVRLRIMRRYKLRRLPFIAVFEATKLGWPHLHILLRSPWIDQRWLSAQMDALIASPVVGIERVDNRGRIAIYVAKYCSDASKKFGTAKRYWCSQDYDLREPPPCKQPLPPGQGWEPNEWSLQRLARAWTELGWRVTWHGIHRIQVDTS